MKSLNISLWNIQGLKSSVFGLKSKNPDFMREIHDLDVIILQENLVLEGMSPLAVPQDTEKIILSSVKLKSTTQGRDSGGMIIWTKSDLSIELVKREQYHPVAENQKRHNINISARLPVCHIHTSPGVLPISKRKLFKNIEQEISHFPGPGKCAAYGRLQF